MDTVGARLKKAREAKNITLEDARKALKMHPDILKAMEEDSAHHFLNPIYIRSFLKSYARFLGLDAEKIIEEYSAGQPAGETEQILHVGPKEEGVEELVKKYTPLAAKIIGGMLALALAIAMLAGVTRFVAASARRISQRTRAAAESARVKKARKTAPEPEKAAPAPKKETSTRPVARKQKPAKEEAPAAGIPKSKPLSLVVKTRDNVWMEVKSDGEIVFRSVLPKGSAEAWNAKDNIELWVGKAEALELILNGVSLGTPGSGVKRGILVTREGVKLP